MTLVGDIRAVETSATTGLYQATFSCDECGWLQIAEAVHHHRQGVNFDTRKLPHWMKNQAQITWWPLVGVDRAFEDVPKSIAEAASEAHRCFSVQAFRATASLARAVVEATAKEKGITSGTISAKIDQLYADKHIREHVKDAAHEIRYLGNEAAHGDFVNAMTAEEAEELVELMAEVLQEVFQSPARVARMQAARQARKAGS